MTVSEPLPLSQQKILAILPKITASFSIFGSAFILYESVVDFRKARRRPRTQASASATSHKGTASIQRALMGLSVFDILFSWAWFMSTWLAPSWSDKIYAVGNQFSCNLQGYLTYLSIGVPLYAAVQIIFTLLLVRYNWTEQQFRRIEPWIHIMVWIIAFGSGAIVLATGTFTPDVPHVPFCANTDPPECYNVPEGQPLPDICGQWAIYTLVLFLIPLWVSVLMALCCIASLYLYVRSTRQRMITRYTIQPSHSLDVDLESDDNKENNNGDNIFLSSSRRKYQSNTTSNNNNHTPPRRSSNYSGVLAAQRQISNRGILYAVSFILTWFWITIGIAIGWAGPPAVFGIWVCQAFFEPLQGFWNFLIFIQNRPKSRQKLQKGFMSILTLCGVFSSKCCQSSSDEEGVASTGEGLNNNPPQRFSSNKVDIVESKDKISPESEIIGDNSQQLNNNIKTIQESTISNTNNKGDVGCTDESSRVVSEGHQEDDETIDA